jgi:Ca2+-binding RTX toxin-like protein
MPHAVDKTLYLSENLGAKVTVRTAGTLMYSTGGGPFHTEPSQYISDSASDIVIAGNGPNELYGNAGNDKMYGKDGNDLLVGGYGRDTLYGGKGADYFVFDRAPSAKNVDRVMDFSHKQGDKIAFSYKYFKAIDLKFKYDAFGHIAEDRELNLPVGRLSQSAFRLGDKALLETDRMIYNKAKGALYYDKDGSGAAEAVKIAEFKAGTALSYSDFLFF